MARVTTVQARIYNDPTGMGHQRFTDALNLLHGILKIEVRTLSESGWSTFDRYHSAWWVMGIHVLFEPGSTYRPSHIKTFFIFDPFVVPAPGLYALLNPNPPEVSLRASRLRRLEFLVAILQDENRPLTQRHGGHLYLQIVANLILQSTMLGYLSIIAAREYHRARLYDFRFCVGFGHSLRLTHLQLDFVSIDGVDLYRYLARTIAVVTMAHLIDISFCSCLLFNSDVIDHWSGILRLLESYNTLRVLSVDYNEVDDAASGLEVYWDQHEVNPIHARLNVQAHLQYHFETISDDPAPHPWDNFDSYNIAIIP